MPSACFRGMEAQTFRPERPQHQDRDRAHNEYHAHGIDRLSKNPMFDGKEVEDGTNRKQDPGQAIF